MNNPLVAGVDIGGSHITAALVDLEVRSVLSAFSTRKSVNSHEDAASIIENWCDAINQLYASQPALPKRIGIAMPGPFDYENGISLMKDQNKYDALYGLNIKELMAGKLGVKPSDIRLMNDAGCFLQGEVVGGAGRGFNSAIGVTLGTGLGTAVFKDGMADDASLWSTPFHNGVAEDYISARWLVKTCRETGGPAVNSVKEMVDLIPAEPRIKDIFVEFGHNLAEFLVFFIKRDNPEVVVIGGNIARSAEWFLPTVEADLQKAQLTAELRIARLGENAHIMGAAGCWMENI